MTTTLHATKVPQTYAIDKTHSEVAFQELLNSAQPVKAGV